MRRTGLARGQGVKVAISSAPKARNVFVSHPRASRRAVLAIQTAHLPCAKSPFWWVTFREQTWVTSRERRSGGRRRVEDADPALQVQLGKILEETSAGDPMSALRWTNKSTGAMAEELTSQGHAVSDKTVARCLRKLGYSMQVIVQLPLYRSNQALDIFKIT